MKTSENDEWLNLESEEFLSKWYETEYTNQSYSGALAKMQKAMHETLEKELSRTTYDRVLEIGANSGEHLNFVKHNYSEYVLSDLRDVSSSTAPLLRANNKLIFIMADVERLPFKDNEFDRVIVTCVLHHLHDPERALKELLRVSKAGSQISIFLPSDPGLLFRLAKFVGPLRKSIKDGLYRVKRLVDARDHINHVFGLSQLIVHTFRNCTIQKRTYPINRMPIDLSLWNIYQITKN